MLADQGGRAEQHRPRRRSRWRPCTETSAPGAAERVRRRASRSSGASGCAIRQPSTSQDEKPAKPRSLGSSATAAAKRVGGFIRRRGTVAENVLHDANPRALVGDGRPQREASPSAASPFDAPQAMVAREIGSGGDIDLLGSQVTRPRFGIGNDVAKGSAARRRPRQRLLRDRRRLDRERDFRRVRLGAQPREQARWRRATSGAGPPSRKSSTMPADKPSRSATPTAASGFHPAISARGLETDARRVDHLGDAAGALDPALDPIGERHHQHRRARAPPPARPPTSTARSR